MKQNQLISYRKSLALSLLALTLTFAGCVAPGRVAAADPESGLTPSSPISATATPTLAEPQPLARVAGLSSTEESTIELFQKLSPSVVYVTNLAVRRVGFNMDVTSIPQGTGSGFVWDKQGTIITNFHVVNGAQDVEITLGDGSVWKAKPVGFEPDKDLAVLDIDAPPEKLTPIPVGESANLRVGQSVLAIGNPFGLDHTLTTGVISGLNREIRSITNRPIQGAIQTDAAINPGNSGGPLLDSSGRLIGVNTAIFSPSGAYAGIGFAVPVDTVSRVVPEILKYGKVTKPGLGIQIASPEVTARLRLDGVLILSIAGDGPAAKAGLKPTTRNQAGRVVLGDILIRLEGERLKDAKDLYRVVDKYKVGDTLEVEYLRDGKSQKARITLDRIN